MAASQDRYKLAIRRLSSGSVADTRRRWQRLAGMAGAGGPGTAGQEAAFPRGCVPPAAPAARASRSQADNQILNAPPGKPPTKRAVSLIHCFRWAKRTGGL